MAKITYKGKYIIANVANIKSDPSILGSNDPTALLKREMNRVFQQANRRLQNIRNAGLVSPAALSLKRDLDVFSVFSPSGKDWNQLKIEYGIAIEFLRQPTSTSTGTHQYANYIKEQYSLSDDEYRYISQYLTQQLTSNSATDFVERFLASYRDITIDIEQAAANISSQLESESQRLAYELDSRIDEALSRATEVKLGDEIIIDSDLLKTFSDFGL